MTSKSTSARWYDADEHDVASTLTSVVEHIRERTRWRAAAHQLHAEMYAGGPAAASYTLTSSAAYGYEPSSLPYNVSRTAADTLVSKIAKHRPQPQVLTSRASWTNQKRARKMTQAIEGEFYRLRIWEKHAPRGVRDSAVYGPGILTVTDEGKRVVAERVPPRELFVDDWDARYGEPRNYYRVRTMDRGVLLDWIERNHDGTDEELEAKKQGILDAANVQADDWDWDGVQDSTVDRVRVVSAWHLPSEPEPDEETTDGRFVLSVLGGCVLVDRAYVEEEPPFAILGYSDPLEGFWPQGLVERLEGYQVEINEMSEKVSTGHHMLGGGMIFLPIGSDVVEQTITNGNVPVIRHQPGKPPIFFNPTPIHPASYQRLTDLQNHALASEGISQQAAQAVKQPGIESGVAIMTLDDIETERFIVFGRAYETWCLQIARLIIKAIKRIAKNHGDYAVSVPMKGGLLDLNWKDVDLKAFEVQVFPTSLLPQQLSGRLEKLKMLFDAQIIDRATFLRQLDAPDLAAEMDLETADRINVDEKLEGMLDADDAAERGVYKAPSSFIDYRWAQKRAQQKLNKAESDGCPEENLDLLRRFIAECKTLIDEEGGQNELAPTQDAVLAPDPALQGAPQGAPAGAPMM